MYGLNKIFLLNDINIIIAIIVVVMSIFIYSLTKYSIYVSFAIVYFFEFMLFIRSNSKYFSEHFYISLSVVFIVKILCIIINRNNMKLRHLDKLLLMSVYFIGLILVGKYIITSIIINLLGNTMVFYKFIYKHLDYISKKLPYIEIKIINKEKYIEDVNLSLIHI